MKTAADTRVKTLTELMIKSYGVHQKCIKIDSAMLLNRDRIAELIKALRYLIFPGYFGKKKISLSTIGYYAGDLIGEILPSLAKEIAKALRHRSDCAGADKDRLAELAAGIAYSFMEQLPVVRDFLTDDIAATYDGDPAAVSLDEIISSYPGIYAITVYRLAHVLLKLEVPLIPRIMTEQAHSVTGIDIHPGAEIGRHFCIDHGTGIVIGETTVIGNFVKIYQGVTLGGISTRGGQSLRGIKRHPTIGDHVTIYAGASILGGSTVIGDGVVVGSNAFIIGSVPEQTKVSIKNPELLYYGAGAVPQSAGELDQKEFWDWVI
jgi:serine O-acetyltransferase